MNMITSTYNAFIKASEGLILKTDRQEYEGRSGPFHTADDVLAYCDDHTLVVLHDLGDGTDDISEDMAGRWLDNRPDTTPHDFVPPFVRNSANYEIHCDEYEGPVYRLSVSSGQAGRMM